MKFLTDENIPPLVVSSLRSCGYEVKDVKEENLQGGTDTFLSNFANKEKLIIVTMDKDFAKLFDKGLIKTGVVYIVHKRQKAKAISERLVSFLKTKEELYGSVAVVD